MPNFLDSTPEDSSDEDTVFVSLADLFSLLSLVTIYLVITFGQPRPTPTSEAVVPSALEGVGAGKAIDPHDTYLTIRKMPLGIEFRVVRTEGHMEQTVPENAGAFRVPEEWLLKALPKETKNGTIYLYLSDEETSLSVRALFTDTQRFLSGKFENLRVTYPSN